MGLRDKFEDMLASFRPKSRFFGGGIGSGHGMVANDDMIVSKPAIVIHVAQIFFNFLALCCFASVAAFQAKWKVGPSGLSGFALCVAIFGILLSSFMLLVPVAYEKYNRLIRLAHAVREVRVSFIMTGTGVTFSLLIAFIVTISAWTQPGCKDPKQDPSAEASGDDFKKALPGWCSTKKAAAIFFWIAFLFWAASLAMLILDWRSGKLFANNQRDTPFQPPIRDEEEAEEEDYVDIPPRRTRPAASGYDTPNTSGGYAQLNPQQRRYSGAPTSNQQTPSPYSGTPAAGRPSMDAYGAFSDPAPSGFGSSGYNNNNSNSGSTTPPSHHHNRTAVGPPTMPEPDFGQPMVSRTMQYADPYAAVRASIGAGNSPTSPQQGLPPSYESYTGYR